MFFADPVAAFVNLGRALRPAGRLVMMVWQTHERNEWDVAIRQSLARPKGAAAIACGGSDPFSLADPPAVERILAAAGFADVSFTDVRETSPSPTSASRSTTARTWPPPSTGFAASRAPAKY